MHLPDIAGEYNVRKAAPIKGFEISYNFDPKIFGIVISLLYICATYTTFIN
jgi:hypothetical protein